MISVDESTIDDVNYTKKISYISKMIQTRSLYFKSYEIFKKNIEIINTNVKNEENEGSNTFTYRWLKGYSSDNGNISLTIEQVITAGLHNIVAFSQFIIILYLILDSENTNSKYLTKYKNSSSDNEKYIIIKELFRREVPTKFVFSLLNKKDHPSQQVIHFLDRIMEKNDKNYKEFKGEEFYKKHISYNNIISSNIVESEVDNETLVEKESINNIPIPKKPLYCPFGLGYRRCAGENFVYFFLKELLDNLVNPGINIIEKDESKLINVGIHQQKPDKFYFKNN